MAVGVAVMTLAAAVAGGGETMAERPALMPWPAIVEMRSAPGEEGLAIGPEFQVAVGGTGGPRVERAARRLVERLARQTGLALPLPGPLTEQTTLEIRCDDPGRPVPHLGMDEAYSLTIDSRRAVLEAASAWGILRGLETFLQLVEPASTSEFRVPTLLVLDWPRFPWRGLLLDSGRHFMGVETVKRTLDGMAAVKLNVLHWHLSDDQGFRVESRRYPALYEKGSDGLFYTQAEIRDVIAYAADRGIRVVPEFDVPGHSTSWFVGHPELATAPGPYAIERRWGIFEPVMDPTKEEVYELLEGFFGEMAAVFPDEFFHIGGDEVKGAHWDAAEHVRAFRQEKGLAENRDLQAHFSRRVFQIVTRLGKQMMGWDEILHADLPKGTVVQAWRNHESLLAAVQQGSRALLSWGYYVDLHWSAARHYAVEPFAAGADELDDSDRKRILGGEAAMWAEFVNEENLDLRLWPRTAAVAERLWSPRQVRDVADMYTRLEATSRWLEWLGLRHRSGHRLMLQRLAGDQADELARLADVVEPLEDYRRGEIFPYTQQTPLNRLVDAVRSESDTARAFEADVDAFLADPEKRAGRESVRARLTEWQGLADRLRPLVESRQLLRETVPLLEQASAVAGVGLEAIGLLEQGLPAADGWRQERARRLEVPEKPAHVLELAYLPAVRKLMDAAAPEVRP